MALSLHPYAEERRTPLTDDTPTSQHQTRAQKQRRARSADRTSLIDLLIGLLLLIVWVGSLQIMLDTGKNSDWFSSNTIVILAVVVSLAGGGSFTLGPVVKLCVAAVIFDEFHERSLNADLGLALALEIRGALRDDLMLVVMWVLNCCPLTPCRCIKVWISELLSRLSANKLWCDTISLTWWTPRKHLRWHNFKSRINMRLTTSRAVVAGRYSSVEPDCMCALWLTV